MEPASVRETSGGNCIRHQITKGFARVTVTMRPREDRQRRPGPSGRERLSAEGVQIRNPKRSAGFFLSDGDAGAVVGRSQHGRNVAPALAGIETECVAKSLGSSDYPPGFELSKLGIGPSPTAYKLRPEFDAKSWIILNPFGIQCGEA
jgi:hypothetical protein